MTEPIRNADHSFVGDSTLVYYDEHDNKDTNTVRADGGNTSNISITDGTLEIKGNARNGVVYAEGGTINFTGDDIIITGEPDGRYGNTSTVQSYESQINFYNKHTYINGFTAFGLQSFVNASMYFANDLTVNIDRSDAQFDNVTEDFSDPYGVLVAVDSSFEVDGVTNVRVKAHKDDWGAWGMQLWGDGNRTEKATFNGNAAFLADGGTNEAYGVHIMNGGTVTFKGENSSITAQNAGLKNFGLYVDDSTFVSEKQTAIQAIGGGDESDESANTGLHMTWNAEAGFNGYTEITAADNVRNNIAVYSEYNSKLNMAQAKLTAHGGENAYGLRASKSEAGFSDKLTVEVSGASDENEGINLYQKSKLTAKDVTVTADGNNASGMSVTDGSTAELSGLLTVTATGGESSGGLSVTEVQSSFTSNGANITATGANSKAFRAETGGSATFNGDALFSAANAVFMTGGAQGTFNGNTLAIAAEQDADANIGINSTNSQINMKSAVVIANGGKKTAGLDLRNGTTANFDGALYVLSGAGADGNSGVKLDSSELTAKELSIKASGADASGIAADFQSTAEVGGHLYVNADGENARAVTVGMGSSLKSGTASLTASGENGRAAYAYAGGTALFEDDADVYAAVAAEAMNDGSAITFAKGFISHADDALMKAADGAAVSVNADGAGTVFYRGTTDIRGVNGDGRIDIRMNGAGSYWGVTGNSSMTSLRSDGALLDMTADGHKFSTLTTNDLSGADGQVLMDIDASTNVDNSDMILVKDTFTGTQYVDLKRTDAGEMDAADTVIARVNNNEGKFIAHDEEGTIFYTRYSLDSKESQTEGYTTDWYIKEVEQIGPDEPVPGGPDDPNEPEQPKETTSVNSIMSAGSLNYHTWRTETDKLMKRMGDLRQSGEDEQGVWFRIKGGDIDLGGRHGFENKYMAYEVGYDTIAKRTENFTRYGGIAFTYTDGESSYLRGDGDNESKSLGFYMTQIHNNGNYLDLVFKLGRWDNDFAVRDTYGERITGETENTGISFSAEFGRKMALGKKGWYIEPQAQLTYGRLIGDNFTTSNGIRVRQDDIDSLVGRVGFNLGWDISKTANVYLKANLLHEFCGDYGVTMSDKSGTARLTGDYGDTWFEYGIGASFKTGKNNFLYFDVERSEGGDLDMEWRWNAGFRFEM